MSKFKLIVASCMPDPEGLSTEPVHYAAGTVLSLSDEDGARAFAQGAAVPFGHDGCPECEKQGRPCTIECWRGFGEKDEDYFPAMVAHEDRKREAAFRARSQPSQEGPPVGHTISDEWTNNGPSVDITAPSSTTEVPSLTAVTTGDLTATPDPVSPPVSRGRKPSETPPST